MEIFGVRGKGKLGGKNKSDFGAKKGDLGAKK